MKFKIFTMLLIVSIASAIFTINAQTIQQGCTIQSTDNSEIITNGQKSKDITSNNKKCIDKIVIKRTFVINPSNINSLLLSDTIAQLSNRQLEQTCKSTFNATVLIEATNSTVTKNNTQKLKCNLVFKETNVFKIAKGDDSYLQKVAKLFNQIASFKAIIIGETNVDLDNQITANNSTVTRDINVNTMLISRVEEKNIIKLSNKFDEATKATFMSYIKPTSEIVQFCNVNGTVFNNVEAINSSNVGVTNNVNNTCSVEAKTEVLSK
jgi:hypothetical protein